MLFGTQVYATGVKVLAGKEEVQELPIQDILPSMEWRPHVIIAAACIADPYVLLVFSDGSAVLLSGDADEGELGAKCVAPVQTHPQILEQLERLQVLGVLAACAACVGPAGLCRRLGAKVLCLSEHQSRRSTSHRVLPSRSFSTVPRR